MRIDGALLGPSKISRTLLSPSSSRRNQQRGRPQGLFGVALRRRPVSARMGNSPSSPRNDYSPRSVNCGNTALSALSEKTPSPSQSYESELANESNDKMSGNFESVLLQGFHWRSCIMSEKTGRSWYEEVRGNIPAILNAGVNVVWLPPPSHSVSAEGYLPQRLYGWDRKKKKKNTTPHAHAHAHVMRLFLLCLPAYFISIFLVLVLVLHSFILLAGI